MAKLKYGIIASVVVAALAVAPLVVSQKIDASLKDKATLLEQNGLKSETLSKSGYLTTQRTFSLEVTDGKKARDFLLAQLVDKNAQYKLFAQALKEETEAGINEALNGLKFKGEMAYSNLLLSDVKVALTLNELPTAVQENLLQDKEASALILPLLTRGVLGIDMLFGKDESLKELKLKDIQEELKVEGGTVNVNTKDHTLKLNHRGESVYGSFGVAHQLILADIEMMKSKSELKDFIYNFTYNNEFNNKADLSIGNYALEIKDEYTNLNAGLGSLKANSSIEEQQKELQMKADYTFDKIFIGDSGDDIKLEKLLSTFFLRGLDTEVVRKLQADYNTLILNETAPSEEVLLNDLIALINHGFKFDVDVMLQGLTYDEISLKDIRVDTKLEIAKNSYTNKQSPLALLGLLEINSKVKVHKDDRATLESLQLTSAEDFALGKAEGDYFVYEFAMKKGAISVNGQVIQ